MSDEITFEELYGEDFWAEFLEDVRNEFHCEDLWDAFLEGIRLEVNFELQEIADLQKQAQVEVELDALT